MKTNNPLILTTSPLSQPERKPRRTVNLTHKQRLLYGRRRYFTGKERDIETGLYYYGARYLDSRTGRWLSGDPAVGDYVPSAPINDEARKRNGSLPGMGGVFNYVNLHVYHYAGNNPVKYIDPDGEDIKGMIRGTIKMVGAVGEVAGGATLAAAAAAGELFSAGLSTPVSIVVGAVGIGMMLDGISRFALATGDFMLEALDTADRNVMDGDIFPSSIGGLVGAVVDKSNGVASSDTGKIGPAQKTGEKINSALSFAVNTTSYFNTVLSSPSAAAAIVNEALHQYDVYETTKTLTE